MIHGLPAHARLFVFAVCLVALRFGISGGLDLLSLSCYWCQLSLFVGRPDVSIFAGCKGGSASIGDR